MDNLAIALNSTSQEAGSQIFVNSGEKPQSGFSDILVSQANKPFEQTSESGQNLQPAGKPQPHETTGETPLTEQEHMDLPVFVSPQETQAPAEQISVPGFTGEAYPVTELFEPSTIPDEVYSLTDADLATPMEQTVTIAPQPPAQLAATGDTQASESGLGLTELASLNTGEYSEEIFVSGTNSGSEARPVVEFAVLTPRPFTQPIPATETATATAATIDALQPETRTPTINMADLTTVSTLGTQPGLTNSIVKGLAPAEEQIPATTAGINGVVDGDPEADITPATSSGNLNAEKMAEIRQIQAYTENLVARTSDGSSLSAQPSTAQGIDIAALNTRMEQAGNTNSLQQPQTSPHALNFREKGWETSFGQNIMWMANKDIKSAQIKIRPAELGPVQIDLSMDKNQLSLQVHANNQIARDTLEAALPRLRAELANNGFADADISFADQGKGQQNGSDSQSGAADLLEHPEHSSHLEEPETIIPATSAMNLMSGTASLLDTFA
jgi:flagellar hook-length control protein FliK